LVRKILTHALNHFSVGPVQYPVDAKYGKARWSRRAHRIDRTAHLVDLDRAARRARSRARSGRLVASARHAASSSGGGCVTSGGGGSFSIDVVYYGEAWESTRRADAEINHGYEREVIDDLAAFRA
jgi:hypothetical protein